MSGTEQLEDRILVLAPTGEDGQLSQRVLWGAGIACMVCDSSDQIAEELERGAAGLLLTDNLFSSNPFRLIQAIRAQPEWSDIPVLLLAGGGPDSPVAASLMESLGNVTVLDRPARIITLISAARSAIRARRRQYEVRDQLLTIRNAQRSLEDESRRKDEFLATLAHELRNPLAPISNTIPLLQRAAREHSELRAVVDVFDRQVHHMVRLVDDLLEVSRITRGKIELRLQVIELASVVYAAVEAARPLVDASHHRLEVSLPDIPVMMRADPLRLTQILTNLLNNAAKYTPAGGSITLSAALVEEGRVVELRIVDTGAGIPQDMLERVFDMFTQVDESRDSSRGGLGVGLALVRRLVELHGGQIVASSAGADRGSEFVVRLPVAYEVPAIAPETQAADSDRTTLGGLRLLVVDDNRDAADSLAMMLSALGARPRTVYNGADALTDIAAHPADVVLLDIGMPGMNGYELAQRLRQMIHDHPHPVLIALTGWGQDEDRSRSRQAGIDHHLIKPVDFAALQDLLRSLPLATS